MRLHVVTHSFGAVYSSVQKMHRLILYTLPNSKILIGGYCLRDFPLLEKGQSDRGVVRISFERGVLNYFSVPLSNQYQCYY